MPFKKNATAVLLLAVLTSASGCQETGGAAVVTRSVPAPSVALMSYDGLGNCAVALRPVPAPWLVVDPKAEYYGATSDPMSDALDGYADAIGRLGAAAYGSTTAQAALRVAILSWAQADAMRWPTNWNDGPDSGPATVYFTTHTLVPVVIAYGEHRALFSATEQMLIEAWIKRLVDRTGNNEWMRRWTLDNKAYLWGSFAMAYGIISDDEAYIQRGVRIYQTAIRGMRSDGSLPNDSGRGGSAIHYSGVAIASLVLTAELAAGRGIDLYGFSAGGRTIHTAIDYLLDATADPRLIAGYAAEDTGASFRGFTPTNQKRDWVNTPAGSWGSYYIKRFDGTPTATRLRAAAPIVRSPRAESNGSAGGVARCLA
ncbi:MAG: alginate lyase family protein [Loktanella sp.]|nr:alginate lyase family protein [Loktanella sp.]